MGHLARMQTLPFYLLQVRNLFTSVAMCNCHEYSCQRTDIPTILCQPGSLTRRPQDQKTRGPYLCHHILFVWFVLSLVCCCCCFVLFCFRVHSIFNGDDVFPAIRVTVTCHLFVGLFVYGFLTRTEEGALMPSPKYVQISYINISKIHNLKNNPSTKWFSRQHKNPRRVKCRTKFVLDKFWVKVTKCELHHCNAFKRIFSQFSAASTFSFSYWM